MLGSKKETKTTLDSTIPYFLFICPLAFSFRQLRLVLHKCPAACLISSTHSSFLAEGNWGHGEVSSKRPLARRRQVCHWPPAVNLDCLGADGQAPLYQLLKMPRSPGMQRGHHLASGVRRSAPQPSATDPLHPHYTYPCLSQLTLAVFFPHSSRLAKPAFLHSVS